MALLLGTKSKRLCIVDVYTVQYMSAVRVVPQSRSVTVAYCTTYGLLINFKGLEAAPYTTCIAVGRSILLFRRVHGLSIMRATQHFFDRQTDPLGPQPCALEVASTWSQTQTSKPACHKQWQIGLPHEIVGQYWKPLSDVDRPLAVEVLQEWHPMNAGLHPRSKIDEVKLRHEGNRRHSLHAPLARDCAVLLSYHFGVSIQCQSPGFGMLFQDLLVAWCNAPSTDCLSEKIRALCGNP